MRIAGKEGSRESLRQSNIDSIISGHIVPEIPYPM